ncbi:MAG: threonine synthase [Bacillota bacterium]|jgi:threonine synthase|nr:threonine synthase [Bacillota bacterium]
MMWRGLLEEFRSVLPVTEQTPVVTLQEGNTPLIPVGEALGVDFPVYVKYEGANPTGSFKDRGMTLAISKAKEEGAKAVICASTGNTSASAAAYAARAGLPCFVLVPEGAVAMGKLSQAVIHGAKVVSIEGNFDEALRIVRQLAEEEQITLVNSLNPYRIEGQKTAAFEICDQLGRAPTHLCIPVGNAGNITAYWRGFRECRSAGLADAVPKMLGFQAEGAAPIVLGHAVEHPETVATAIRIGNPVNWQSALAARDESGGLIEAVSDEKILEAYRLLAARTGIFCEPASAASVAGLLELYYSGYFNSDEEICAVCVLTGHGLKDPDNALAQAPELIHAPADYAAIRTVIMEG